MSNSKNVAEAYRNHVPGAPAPDDSALKAALDVEHKMLATMAETRPATPEIGESVAAKIRGSIYLTLSAGKEPEFNRRAAGNVKYQVAYESLQEALRVKQIMGQPAVFDPAHREIVIRQAERLHHGTKNPIWHHDANNKALDLSRQIAQVDFPAQRNPFSNPELTTQYQSEQNFERYMHLARMAQDRDRGGR